MTEIANLDHDRIHRRGYPEAVYCEGKTPDQLRRIAVELREYAQTHGPPVKPTIFTRADGPRRAAVTAELPDALEDDLANLLIWPPTYPEPTGGLVVVACAGTSDLPIAKEAWHTARALGRASELVVDIGIAGVHRALAKTELFQQADVVIAVAGMDGALPGLIAGLTCAPVIAVPTSVGYGAAFGGVSALLTMLNSCAPGVAVVNIDNGYGAGHIAAQIAAPERGGHADLS